MPVFRIRETRVYQVRAATAADALDALDRYASEDGAYEVEAPTYEVEEDDRDASDVWPDDRDERDE